ncbi:MAG: O-antigen ligase family protein [Terracidiphilus sp.]
MNASAGLERPMIDGATGPVRAGEPKPSAALVWLAAIGGALLLAALFAAHQSTLLRAAVPAVAAVVALTLYLRRPIAYIHFTLWTWFLTPFLRRVIDWRFGFEDQSLVLLAPFLVTAVAGITIMREGRRARGMEFTPYLLCGAGILYGFCVGIIRWKLHASVALSIGGVVYGLFLWLAPVVFGLHLHLHWKEYEAQKAAILTTFKWGVLVLGVYGIYQYVRPPAWDCAWLEGIPGGWESSSFGQPFPFEIRVWSTMNSPGLFAAMMLPGLILLNLTKTRLKPIIAAAGYGAFLLSLVRTGWLAWILAMLLLAVVQRSAMLKKFILFVLLLPICLVPILLVPQFRQTIEDRLDTLTDLSHDGSMNDRKMLYKVVASQLLSDPAGVGLVNGSTFSVDEMPLDSGVIQTVLMLGFIGTAFYAMGILLGVGDMMRRRTRREGRPDEFANALRVLFVVMLLELVGSNVFVNFFGCILWTSYGLWGASRAAVRDTNPLLAAQAIAAQRFMGARSPSPFNISARQL